MVSFEMQYHLDLIKKGKLSIKTSRTWYQQHRDLLLSRDPELENNRRHPLEVFARIVTPHLLPISLYESLPETMYLDFSRIDSLRRELSDVVYASGCYAVLQDLRRRVCKTQQGSEEDRESLRSTLYAICKEATGEQSQRPIRWSRNLHNVAAELVRMATEMHQSS
ncbi:MAG: hypothetical protein Q9198_007369, partial [Flavoplaca austrocitrina]